MISSAPAGQGNYGNVVTDRRVTAGQLTQTTVQRCTAGALPMIWEQSALTGLPGLLADGLIIAPLGGVTEGRVEREQRQDVLVLAACLFSQLLFEYHSLRQPCISGLAPGRKLSHEWPPDVSDAESRHVWRQPV
ncbi:hypothetical protein BaRGS_00013510 [Batillaria attramentaria]|uniref:Uncharacterized protein n=1 Tax=Batillaria attramentaria TaxID=370345 RepID=A0ABD0L7P0_9CAEN